MTKKPLGLAVLSVIALLLGAQAVYAQSTQIYGCVSARSGALRIIQIAGPCAKGETLLTWNVQGPAGKDGAPGEQGLSGADFRTTTGTITGQLTSCDLQQNLAATAVSILGHSFTAFTDTDGTFKLWYLPPNNYTIGIPAFNLSAPVTVTAANNTPLGELLVTDVLTDQNNCGSCGHVCTGGTTCQGGVCNECATGATQRCDPAATPDACLTGMRTCISGSWGACVQDDFSSHVEVCDGIDNDCDGVVDEGDLCPAGQVCRNAACVNPATLSTSTGLFTPARRPSSEK